MAHVGGIDRVVYCGARHAIEGFTKAMAIELGGYGIRINTICSTFIRTPLKEPTFSNPNRVKWPTHKIEWGGVGEITDIMGPAGYLASHASAMMTGAHLLIDWAE
jgi:NAD(P)-dependent dehydrogenase (short-subunit alcohol dehydrogenase family)